MNHQCGVKEKNAELDNLSRFQKFKLISYGNSLRLTYFRSNLAVKNEQLRQLKVNTFAIHPFSKCRAWYEMYLIYLYGSLLITKPMDAAFVKFENCSNMNVYIYYNILTDILSWIDILINFFTGYEIEDKVELRKWYIIRHYVFSPYFICDVFSSIPKCVIYGMMHRTSPYKLGAFGATAVLGLFKVVRIVSFVKCIWRTADYLRSVSKGLLSLSSTIIAALAIIHWLACMQFAVPRLYTINFAPILYNNSWFFSRTLYNGTLYSSQSILTRYNHCIFKSSAYILGIRLVLYEEERPEEYVLGIITYFIGKVLIASLWIILASAILNFRVTNITFAGVINQLQEYMKQRQLPLGLRERILQYFFFKYKDEFFEENLIINLLSESLKTEANMQSCKSLLVNCPLFGDLTSMEISKIVNYLIPVIFLPNDIIVRAGTHGDAMYFISSGTVAVYTRTGKEVCHLQDGAYFGEISLVIKGELRAATITALETSFLFRLNRKDFEKYLLSNKSVMLKMLRHAEEMLGVITNAEEGYKKAMIDQSMLKLPTLNSD